MSGQPKARIVGQPGSEATHKKSLQRFRRTLEGRGYRPERIDRLVAERKAFYDGLRAQWEADAPRRERVEDETYRRLSLKDTSHRPRSHDPLTTGQARVTGETARAVKRGTTITLHEHRERDAR